MRTPQRLSRTVTVTALGAVLLTAGATGTAGAATPGPRATAAASAARAAVVKVPALPWRDATPEARFRKWAGNLLDSCLPARPGGATGERAGLSATTGTPVDEVRLGLIEQCVGDYHRRHIAQAFPTGPADYAQLRARLVGLGYPAERVHRVPGHHGSPVARIDLRLGRFGGDVAVDVTGYRYFVTVEPFGVPASPSVDVTDVRRKPVLDGPTS
ncbi:hypothetical protein ACF1BN_16090 [Streptomyces sp. NPDC014861]|uniref:hypothetical protein n=1 Tax=Streptomyces sp. NPDC014861 TaxID=3364923 RepID=UPI0036F9F268